MKMNETKLSIEDNLIESLSNSDHVKDEAGNEEHCDKTLVKCKEEIELLENFLGECGNRKEMVTKVFDNRREFLKVMETEECFNLQTNSLFAGTMNRMNERDAVIEEIEQRLFGDEMEVHKQQEGKDIKVAVRNHELRSESNQ